MFGPGHDGAFKDVGFILLRALRVDDFSVGKRKQCPALAQPYNNVCLCDEVVEPLHEILGDEIGPTLLVVWILHDGTKHLIANGMHMLKHILGHLQKDDIVLEVLLFELLGPNTEDDEACIR